MNLLQRQNIKYKLVVFDFDGTIADTSEGIIDSHIFTLKSLGIVIPEKKELKALIGGNLLKTYMHKFNLSENNAREAVKIYRKRYAEVGIFKTTLYPSIDKLFEMLQKNIIKIALATLKAEKFAYIMLEQMGVLKFFNYICGMDENDSFDKAGLIEKCMLLGQCDPSNTIVIGDSKNDLIGAEKAKTNFIGVTYGFGFEKNKRYDFLTAENVEELLYLLKKKI